MKALLLVMTGGAVGAALRYLVGRGLSAQMTETGWPWGTFAVNLLGGFAMGVLAGWLAARGEGNGDLRLLLGVGILGGFTTFSAFSLEMAMMIERGQVGLAFVYAALSVLAALLALFVGLWLARGVLA